MSESPLDLTKGHWQDRALDPEGPTCLVIRAELEPVAGMDRFQPSGFPEIGHVLYDSPTAGGEPETICIVDSPASMANHLETVCTDGPAAGLHPDLKGLPYVRCVTDRGDFPNGEDRLERLVCTTLNEGHRLASDYFLDGCLNPKWTTSQGRPGWTGDDFREVLRQEFGVKEVKKGKTYFIWPDTWWSIYGTIFKYDPNSLIHGVMFAKEQIRITRMLTAHMEAYGASRVTRSGIKFDRLGKTTSGQPIFAVDDETAHSIVATFILDLALLRSYGREGKGLTPEQKRLLLDLAAWKIKRLLSFPFRFRSGCHLRCRGIGWSDHSVPVAGDCQPEGLKVDIEQSISHCNLDREADGHKVYYPSEKLFTVAAAAASGEQAVSDGATSD
jgi:CRISPR-associated protein Csb1